MSHNHGAKLGVKINLLMNLQNFLKMKMQATWVV